MKKTLLVTNVLAKIMRFTAVQMVLMVLGITFAHAHETRSQELLNQPVSINVQSVQIKDVLNSIEAQTTGAPCPARLGLLAGLPLPCAARPDAASSGWHGAIQVQRA